MSIFYRDVRPVPMRRLSPTVYAVVLGTSFAVLGGCQDQARTTSTPTAISESAIQQEVSEAESEHLKPVAIRPVTDDVGSEQAASPTNIGTASNLSVSELVAVAKRLHPTTQAIAAARRAADARVVQAGAWANPELSVSYGRTNPRISDIPTDRPYGASLSQRFEWWGKRQARLAAAQAEIAITEADAAVLLRDLEVEVRLAAIAYTTARAALEQTKSQVTLAQELTDVVTKRHAVGDIDVGEVARVRVEASTARLHHESAQRAVITTLEILRTWCGDSLADDLVISDAIVDDANGDVAANEMHPLVRAAIESERASAARAAVERQNRIPDITLGIYGDREWEKDTLGITLGVEIPLWNQNAGGIAAADAERERLIAMRQLEERRLRKLTTEAIGAWQLAHGEVTLLRDEVLPAATDAVRLRTTAYKGGDAGLADVLDARRALLSVQTDLLDARQRMAEALVQLFATTGTTGGRP